MEKVRIDKWLWAARFFKTRSLAKAAVEGGKIHCEGSRVKASKEIQLGTALRIRQGWDEKDVIVTGLSDKRGSATAAALLYKETEESLEKRKEEAARRRALRDSEPKPDTRPSKKERRQIHRFNQQNSDE